MGSGLRVLGVAKRRATVLPGMIGEAETFHGALEHYEEQEMSKLLLDVIETGNTYNGLCECDHSCGFGPESDYDDGAGCGGGDK